MRQEDYRLLLDALLPSVLAAGRIEMAHFKAGVAVETKADTTPVTIADHEAEEVLLAGLSAAAPACPGDRGGGGGGGAHASIGGRFFLVDPLDGTRAFIRNSPEFTVNIGLIEDGSPVFGIIYAPALSLLYATLDREHAVEAKIAPATRRRSTASS